MIEDRARVLGAAALFATGGAAIKLTALSGLQVACFRSGLAALFLFVVMPRWRRFLNLRCLLVGVAFAATMVLFVSANKRTTAASAILLQSTAPLYVLALAPRLLGERPGARDLWLGLALLAGLALFFLGSEPAQSTAPAPLEGNLLATAASLCWAATLLGLRWLGRSDGQNGPPVIAGNLLACLACLPFALPVRDVGFLDLALVLHLGILQIGLAYLLLTVGLRRLPALEASLLLLCEPVLSALLAWLVHGEQLGPFSLAGGALILAATVARSLAPGPARP